MLIDTIQKLPKRYKLCVSAVSFLPNKRNRYFG